MLADQGERACLLSTKVPPGLRDDILSSQAKTIFGRVVKCWILKSGCRPLDPLSMTQEDRKPDSDAGADAGAGAGTTAVHEYKQELAEVVPKSRCLNLPSPNFQKW